ncbi:MAG: hypothetical protein U0L59_04390, partial [Faecalimonas sp.]|nr:hypothetical protein [Faecalimonas sp.]
KSCSLMNNTPFVVSVCIIILLVAVLVFVLCIKKVPTTSKGEEIIASVKGKTITADELYLKLLICIKSTNVLNINILANYYFPMQNIFLTPIYVFVSA